MFFTTLLVLALFQGSTAPPVVQETTTKQPSAEDLVYFQYLQEVFSTLNDDKEWVEKIKGGIKMEAIQDGSIARHLKFVSHNVRSKLDEVKRREIERLRDLALAQQQLHDAQGNKNARPFQMPLHLDLKDHQFNEEDLQKLISQTTKDLEKADKERQKEFKNYEMEKEHLRREKLKHAKDEAEKKALEKEYDEMKKKHNDHEKFNHPGSKKQLEEVWEEDDKMDPEDFNPKTFFELHDVNGDHFLDQAEVEALFQKELNKAYDANKSEDDMMERYEEMNRMREHVFKEFDKDKDGLISYDEFFQATQKPEFEKPEEEYKPLEEEEVFTDEEFQQFEDEYYPTMMPQKEPTKAPEPTSSVHPTTPPSETDVPLRDTPPPPVQQEMHPNQQGIVDVQMQKPVQKPVDQQMHQQPGV